jgi:hypothetical protein
MILPMSWRRVGPALAFALALTPSVVMLVLDGPTSFLLDLVVLVGLGSLTLVGALYAARHPGNPVGWLLMVGTFGAGLNALSETMAVAAGPSMARLLLVVAGVGVSLHSSAFGLVALLFPNGRLISRNWQWAVWLMIGSLLLVWVAAYQVSGHVVDVDAFIRSNWSFEHAEPLPTSALVLFVAAVVSFTAALLLAGVSMVWRMRHGASVERQQVKWVVYAVVVAVVFGLSLILITAGEGPSNLQLRLLYISLAATLIAAALGIAIFRYHLYDIDSVVRLSVIYGIAVATLGATYALGIVLIPAILPDSGSLAVAGTTLAVAALFNPLRRRVQKAVDRRFYRTRHDPGRVSDGLNHRIRDEVDAARIMTHFAITVEEVFAPEGMAYWVRDLSESLPSRRAS